jgi:hypothetical protein
VVFYTLAAYTLFAARVCTITKLLVFFTVTCFHSAIFFCICYPILISKYKPKLLFT